MKKFIALLLVLLMIPLYTFAANSPTMYNTVSSHPKMTFFFADQTVGWKDILPRLEELNIKDYVLLEALAIYIDKTYKKVEWELSIPIKAYHEPIAYLVNDKEIIQLDSMVTDNETLITDLSEIKPGTYYICFYIKGA